MYQGKPCVLYIHGFESSPIASKTSAIADLGCAVIAPQIHYKEAVGTFNRIKQLATEFKADWIIGSSLGGYSAFWLSQQLQIPTLLFNPALAFRRIDPGLISEKIEITNCNQVIFLGMNDTTVDPNSTKIWLKQQGIIENVNIIEHPENGHQISLKVFKETISKAAIDLNIFQSESSSLVSY